MDIVFISERLGLKKAGGEYKGPCPICGGNDRFHIKEAKNGATLVHCRQGCTYAEIMRELETRGLVEKTPYQKTKYKLADLRKADMLVLVGLDNVTKGYKFNAKDFLAVSSLITRVDQERREKLQNLLTKMRQGVTNV